MNEIVRTAALELQTLNGKEVVKVAGIVRRLKNWIKSLTNDEYSEIVDQVRSDTFNLQTTLNNLNEDISKMLSAIKDGDIEEYETYLDSIKGLSVELVGNLKELNKDVTQVPQPPPELIPEPVPKQTEAPMRLEDHPGVTPQEGKLLDKKNKTPEEEAVVNRILDREKKRLPPDHDVPYGKHNEPLRNFNWFRKFKPDDIGLRDAGERSALNSLIIKVKESMRTNLFGSFSDEEAFAMADELMSGDLLIQFINRLQNAILNGTLLLYIPEGSPIQSFRPSNQNKLIVRTAEFLQPGTNHRVQLTVKLTDMFSAKDSHKSLRFGFVSSVHFSNQPSPVEASKLNQLKKMAEIQPYKVTKLSDVEFAKALAQGHRIAFGKLPSIEKLGIAWAQCSLESGRPVKLPNNNVGNIKATKDWVKAGNPYFVKDTQEFDAQHKSYIETGTKWRSYNSPAEGAAGYWRLLGRGFQDTIAWMEAGDPVSSAVSLGQKGYYTANIRKYSNAVQALYSQFMKDIAPSLPMIKSNIKPPPGEKLVVTEWRTRKTDKPKQEPEFNVGEVDTMINELFASGPVENIVRHGLERKLLPMSDVLVSLSNLSGSFNTRLEFAKAASKVLKEIIDADVSINSDGDKIELQCKAAGSMCAVSGAINALCSCVSDAAKLKRGSSISYLVIPGAISKFGSLA